MGTPRILRVALFAISAVSSPLVAQVPVQLEGPVTAIEFARDATGPRDWVLEVMGVRFRLGPDFVLAGPTRTLSPAELLGPPLPGRRQPGFLGSTAIVVGTSVGDQVTVTAVALDPAENLLAGVLGQNRGGGLLTIQGLGAEPVGDPRLPTVIRNEFLFEIRPETIPTGSFVSAEGYFGEDGVFHYHTLDATGDLLGSPFQTSIERARVDASLELDLRGFSTTPAGTVQVFVQTADRQDRVGKASITPDADDPRFGVYRLKQTLPYLPDRVWVVNANGSSAVATVDGP